MNNYVVNSRITYTGQKTRNVVHFELFFNRLSYDQLLIELRIKIYLDKYSNFASEAAKGCLDTEMGPCSTEWIKQIVQVCDYRKMKAN